MYQHVQNNYSCEFQEGDILLDVGKTDAWVNMGGLVLAIALCEYNKPR